MHLGVNLLYEFDVIERIKLLCSQRNWSYYKLAKNSKIPYSTLNTMILKTNAPSVATLIKICNGFNITLSQFFADEESVVELTPEQINILSLWDNLDEDNKKLAMAYLSGLANKKIQ